MSGLSMQHSFAAGPHGVRGSDPDRLSGLEALRKTLVLPTRPSMTSCPHVVFRPDRPGRGHPGVTLARAVSAGPGIPLRAAGCPVAISSLFPSGPSFRCRHRRRRAVVLPGGRQRPDHARHPVCQRHRRRLPGIPLPHPGDPPGKLPACRLLLPGCRPEPGSCPGHGGSSPSAAPRHGRPWRGSARCREWSSTASSRRASGLGSGYPCPGRRSARKAGRSGQAAARPAMPRGRIRPGGRGDPRSAFAAGPGVPGHERAWHRPGPPRTSRPRSAWPCAVRPGDDLPSPVTGAAAGLHHYQA